MKIKFIQKIIDELADIKSVRYTFVTAKDNFAVTFSKNTLQKYVNADVFSFQLHRKAFVNALSVAIVIDYVAAPQETITFNNVLDLT